MRYCRQCYSFKPTLQAQFSIQKLTLLTSILKQVDAFLLNMIKTTPTSAIGQPGDVQGMTAMDSNYIYSCNAIYDGVTEIWARTPLNTSW